MKNLLITLLVLCVVQTSIVAQNRLYGELRQNIPYSATPYIIDETIIIPKNVSITIEAGCVFLFSPFTTFIIKGGLIVAGTKQYPVVFTSLYDSLHSKTPGLKANLFDWNGIVIEDQTDTIIRFNNFRVSYSDFGIQSLTKKIILSKGIFRNNGSNFSINNRQIFVKNNELFDFNTTIDYTTIKPGPTDTGTGKTNEKNNSGSSTILANGSLIFTTVTALASLYGGFEMYHLSQDHKNLQTLINKSSSILTPHETDSLNKKSLRINKNFYFFSTICIATGTVTVLSIPITLYFHSRERTRGIDLKRKKQSLSVKFSYSGQRLDIYTVSYF